jgi:hypothetical protein
VQAQRGAFHHRAYARDVGGALAMTGPARLGAAREPCSGARTGAGMCGGFVAFYAGGDGRGRWAPHLAYNLGRLLLLHHARPPRRRHRFERGSRGRAHGLWPDGAGSRAR